VVPGRDPIPAGDRVGCLLHAGLGTLRDNSRYEIASINATGRGSVCVCVCVCVLMVAFAFAASRYVGKVAPRLFLIPAECGQEDARYDARVDHDTRADTDCF